MINGCHSDITYTPQFKNANRACYKRETTSSDIRRPGDIQLNTLLNISKPPSCSAAKTTFGFESIHFCNNILNFEGTELVPNIPTTSFRLLRRKLATHLDLHWAAQRHSHHPCSDRFLSGQTLIPLSSYGDRDFAISNPMITLPQHYRQGYAVTWLVESLTYWDLMCFCNTRCFTIKIMGSLQEINSARTPQNVLSPEHLFFKHICKMSQKSMGLAGPNKALGQSKAALEGLRKIYHDNRGDVHLQATWDIVSSSWKRRSSSVKTPWKRLDFFDAANIYLSWPPSIYLARKYTQETTRNSFTKEDVLVKPIEKIFRLV